MGRSIHLVFSLLILCLVLGARPGHAATTGNDEFWSKDRQAHAAISAILSPVIYVSMRNLRTTKYGRADAFFGSVVLVTLLGAVKEVTDRPMDEKDLAANAAGALVGSLFVLAFDF